MGEGSTTVITPVSGVSDHINYSDCVSLQLGLIVLSDRQFWVCLFFANSAV